MFVPKTGVVERTKKLSTTEGPKSLGQFAKGKVEEASNRNSAGFQRHFELEGTGGYPVQRYPGSRPDSSPGLAQNSSVPATIGSRPSSAAGESLKNILSGPVRMKTGKSTGPSRL